MRQHNQSIVKQAVTLFKQGEFKQAKSLYQQAANQYGSRLFTYNIQLCERRMGQPAVSHSPLIKTSLSLTSDSLEVAQQLDETQKLLEYYYSKCQEMEYQLMDRK